MSRAYVTPKTYSLITTIYNNAWNRASTANSYIGQIPSLTGRYGDPAVTSANDVAIPVEPDVEIPRIAEGAELAKFHILTDAIIDKLVEIFRNYMNEFLPNECPYLEKAQLWICRTLSGNNPTGISAQVEAMIWNRERDRILSENGRAKEDVIREYSARGYPMPPGAMYEAVLSIERKNMEEIGKSSRDIAIEMAKIEIENMKFAVEKAIELYVGATQAAGEYIKALAMGPQIGMEVIPSVTDSQSKLIEAANSYYQSRIRIAEMIQKNWQFNAEMKNKSASEGASLNLEWQKTNVQAAVDKAKTAATQAAAALNAVSASVQFGSSYSMSIGYNYSNDTDEAATTYYKID